MSLFGILEQDLQGKEVVAVGEEGPSVGLSSKEAARRGQEFGENVLKSRKKIHPIGIFINQYKDILTVILLVSTAVSILLGEYVDAIVIAVVVLLNGVMGFLQEYRTEQTLEKLKQMAAPMAKVYRDGRLQTLSAAQLVVGDVVALEAGDRIPADVSLQQVVNFSVDEAILTGESNPQNKQVKETSFMGTTAVTGRARGVVSAIGMKTEMGRIAHLLNEVEEPLTQLQQRLKQLGLWVALGCLAICLVVSTIGLLRGESLLSMLLLGVSLAVAAVPEGLPAVVTVSLALAVGRMVRKRALVRKLHAVETLGCTTVICSDKTGTLTQNKMTVVSGYTLQGQVDCTHLDGVEKTHPLYPTILCGLVCNNADLNGRVGDPTELALLQIAAKSGVAVTEKRLDEIPFDSKSKQMSVTVKLPEGQTVRFIKGAPDLLLAQCTHCLQGDTVLPFNQTKQSQVKEANDKMAARALRVLGFARQIEGGDLCFLGLLGMMDPPRPEVKKAVAACYKAGIKTVMITGDHLLTAKAVAEQIGIYHEGDAVVEGKSLEEMDEKTRKQIIKKATVYARVTPRHKLLIVQDLQEQGQVVAMTGDGVNDAPAVKQADIGVSMGITGTDVTKEAADITLLDDNFATLVHAVEEGRVIYTNIRKFIRYLLSCNIGEVLTMFLGLLMGMPMVLLPIHILTINLITDGLPAICLGLEPAAPGMMNRPPRGKGESVFAGGLLTEIIFRGMFIGLATLAAFMLVAGQTADLTQAQTAAYTTLVLTQLVNVFACKGTDSKLTFAGLFNNPKLLWAVLLSLIILLVTIYVPPIALLFGTTPLTVEGILTCLGCMLFPSVLTIFLKQPGSS